MMVKLIDTKGQQVWITKEDANEYLTNGDAEIEWQGRERFLRLRPFCERQRIAEVMGRRYTFKEYFPSGLWCWSLVPSIQIRPA